jgi:hypothetical protein
MPCRAVSSGSLLRLVRPPITCRYTANRQPGKALPFFLRLRRPNVFDLISEHNLFTDVQDQALLLVEFDHELMEKGGEKDPRRGTAIQLLVDHTYSIPVRFLFSRCCG